MMNRREALGRIAFGASSSLALGLGWSAAVRPTGTTSRATDRLIRTLELRLRTVAASVSSPVELSHVALGLPRSMLALAMLRRVDSGIDALEHSHRVDARSCHAPARVAPLSVTVERVRRSERSDRTECGRCIPRGGARRSVGRVLCIVGQSEALLAASWIDLGRGRPSSLWRKSFGLRTSGQANLIVAATRLYHWGYCFVAAPRSSPPRSPSPTKHFRHRLLGMARNCRDDGADSGHLIVAMAVMVGRVDRWSGSRRVRLAFTRLLEMACRVAPAREACWGLHRLHGMAIAATSGRHLLERNQTAQNAAW